MTISKDYWIFSVVAVLVAYKLSVWTLGNAEGNVFEFTVSPPTVEAGERATLEIRLKKSDTDASPKIDDSLLTQSQNFIILHSEQKEENGIFIWRYEITSYKLGSYAVPPLSVRYGANSYSTERKNIEVSSTRSAEDEAIREDFPKLWPPIPWKKILLYGVFLLLTPFVFKYISRKISKLPWKKLKPKVKLQPTVPPIDPLLWLKRELKLLRERTEFEGENAVLIDDLTWVLRRFLFLKYAEPFPNRTTTEFQASLKKFQSLTPLLEPFQRFDAFKFSPQKDSSVKTLVLNGIQIAELTLCGT